MNRARGSVTEANIKNWFKEIYELLGEDASILEEPNQFLIWIKHASI